MSLPTEALLAEDLRVLAPMPASGPDVDAIIRRGRRLGRRRIAAASVGASAVVAGAVAVVAAVSVGQPGVAARPTAVAAGSQPAIVRPAASPAALSVQLTAAFTKAVAASKVTVVATVAGGTTETITVPGQKWQEEVVWSAAGVKQSESFTSEFAGTGKHAGEAGLKNLYLDYSNRTFSVTTSYLARGVHAQLFAVPQPESLTGSSWSRLAGSAIIDGQPAYVLAQSGSGRLTATTWVSKVSLLPLKSVLHTASAGTQTDQYRWSSATGATAAANTPAIPAGFVRGDSAAGLPAFPASR